MQTFVGLTERLVSLTTFHAALTSVKRNSYGDYR